MIKIKTKNIKLRIETFRFLEHLKKIEEEEKNRKVAFNEIIEKLKQDHLQLEQIKKKYWSKKNDKK